MQLTLDTSGFSLALQRYVTLTGADAEAAAVRASRTYMRYLLAITPPGDGRQQGERAALTKADERRARASIDADLARLFIGVRLRGKREEQWPDVAGLHRQAFISGKTPGKRIKRVGPVKYVDQRKLRALARDLYAAVGRLAANWLAGLAATGSLAGAPAWVKRHGVGGFGQRTPPGAPLFRLEAANPAVPSAIAAELDRRGGYASLYTQKSLERQLQAILARRAAAFNRAA